MAAVPSSCDSHCQSLGCYLGHLGKLSLGVMLLAFGIVLIVTLWLMPIGLPLTLLGAGLIAAGRSRL